MKMHAIAAAALAGLSTGAMGQSLSVNLSYSSIDVSIGETVTATVSASFTGMPAGAYLSSVNIDLIASRQIGTVSNISAVAWNNAGLGFDGQGTASGTNVLGIEASQFSLIPPITAGSPIIIMTFDLTISAEGPMTYRAEVADGAPFPFSVTGVGFSDQPMQFGVDVFHAPSIGIPTPSVLAISVVGGLLAVRRRRVGS